MGQRYSWPSSSINGGGSLGEAARLLRSAEPLARSAAALLLMADNEMKKGAAEAYASAPASMDARPASRSSRRRSNKKKKNKFVDGDTDVLMQGGSSKMSSGMGGLATVLSSQGIVDTSGTTLSSSPSDLNADAKDFFPPGAKVKLSGMASRLDLEGSTGTVLIGGMVASHERLAVTLEDESNVQVKASNLQILRPAA